MSKDLKFVFIPCYAGAAFGYFIYDISDIKNIKYVSKGINDDLYGIIRIVLHPKKNIIFILNWWDYIFSVDFSSLYNGIYP